jgi:hypothetical protein
MAISSRHFHPMPFPTVGTGQTDPVLQPKTEVSGKPIREDIEDGGKTSREVTDKPRPYHSRIEIVYEEQGKTNV